MSGDADHPAAGASRAAHPSAVVDDGHGVARVPVAVDDLPDMVHRMSGQARLADMFVGLDHTDTPVLRLVWAQPRERRYLISETAVRASRYPSPSDLDPAAYVEECEIYEQFGLRPVGVKPLDRVAVPPYAGSEFPRLGNPPGQEPRDLRAPHTVGGQAFEFPVGPVRAVGVESLYYGLVTSGEEIVDLYLFTWHKHRGVEWRLRGLTPRRALFFVERAEGLSAVAHGWAFAAAVERACGIPVSPWASRVRAVALESERIYNHAAAIVALCQATGLSVGQAGVEMALENLLRLNAKVFGHRFLFGVLDIGGVARAPDLAALRAELPVVCAQLRRVTDGLDTTNSFLDRLERTGIVDGEQAVRLGLVGPTARASGVDIDTRREHPHPPYDTHPANPARHDGGDVLARYRVFLVEIDESLRLIDHLARTTSPAPTPPSVEYGPGGTGLGWAESARGEVLTWVDIDTGGRISRARLRPAAVRNWRAFDDAARSQNVFTDIPIIEASFWLTAAGRAR